MRRVLSNQTVYTLPLVLAASLIWEYSDYLGPGHFWWQLPSCVLLTDVLFYYPHRVMHSKWLYRHIHKTITNGRGVWAWQLCTRTHSSTFLSTWHPFSGICADEMPPRRDVCVGSRCERKHGVLSRSTRSARRPPRALDQKFRGAHAVRSSSRHPVEQRLKSRSQALFLLRHHLALRRGRMNTRNASAATPSPIMFVRD